MVQLTAVRKEIDPKTGKPKLPWWHLSKFAKINISIAKTHNQNYLFM